MKRKTIAFIKPVPSYIGWPSGTHNGYVAIQDGHKCYGANYEDINVNVHGGLTFGKYGDEIISPNFGVHWFDDVEILTPDCKEIPLDWYIVGFDTCHWGDNPANWNKEKVIKETLDLQKQLEEV